MAKFRVLVGKHSEGTHADGTPCVYYANGSGDGSVVETDKDLSRHNSPGAVKFQRLDDSPVAEAARKGFYNGNTAPLPKPPKAIDEENALGDGLEDLTVSDLRQLAAQEEIDLGNANRKDQIISVIRAAHREA